MGSSLSGRRDGKPLVEDCITIDLARLMRLAPIGLGQSGHGQLRWSVDGQPVKSICFRLDFRDPANVRLILNFDASQPDGEHNTKIQTIALTATQQHLGGKRWWFRCPATGERVRTLHLPPNGSRFASRKDLGLAYRVERLNHFDRPFEKVFRLQRKLCGMQGLATTLDRPKGMWRRTFARHLARLGRHDLDCMDQIAKLIKET